MPYNGAGPTVGANLNPTMAGNAEDEEELLRRFTMSMMGRQGAPFQAATVPKPGAFLDPNHMLVGVGDQELLGVGDPGGGMGGPGGEIPVGFEMMRAPQLSMTKGYTKNPGLNAYINNITKKGMAGGAKAGLLASL
jgi:hypothetical protein